jgi:hypothetical protein
LELGTCLTHRSQYGLYLSLQHNPTLSDQRVIPSYPPNTGGPHDPRSLKVHQTSEFGYWSNNWSVLVIQCSLVTRGFIIRGSFTDTANYEGNLYWKKLPTLYFIYLLYNFWLPCDLPKNTTLAQPKTFTWLMCRV